MTEPNMWAGSNPRLQLAWDSTSLSQLQFCPRSYQLSIIEGWTGEALDLEFGIMVHDCMDVFARARLNGDTRDEAQFKAVKHALLISGTYDGDEFRPWAGRYEYRWRCIGTEPYKNEKGNKAKCPLSHKGKYEPGPRPSTCGVCGSPTEGGEQWVPKDPKKDRYNLVRLVAWYAEEQPERLEDGEAPYKFPDGTPAVELPVRVPLPFKTKAGETFILAGYLDKISTFGDAKFIVDYKSTRKYLGADFFSNYNPSMQMDTYDLMGSIVFPELELEGVMIHGMQVLTDAVKFGYGPIYRTEGQREEHLRQIGLWLQLAEQYAEAGEWPMAKANCWMCDFKGICSKAPGVREMYLKGDFTKRHWNPLLER